MGGDGEGEPYFLDFSSSWFFCFSRFLFQLIEILSVVTDFAYRGINMLGYLDEVQLSLLRFQKRFCKGYNPNLFSIGVDQPYLLSPDLIVYENSFVQAYF